MVKLKGESNVNLTHLLYVEQNFVILYCEEQKKEWMNEKWILYFFDVFATNFKILPLHSQKIFVFISPSICCIPFIFK